MKKIRSNRAAQFVVGCALAVMGSSAMAAWSFGSGSTVATDANITATATGVSTTSTAATFAAATVGTNGAWGLGVIGTGESTGTPDHSVDSSGATDAILLSFSKSVVLTGVTSGWTWKNDTLAANDTRLAAQAASDSDASLLYYAGKETDAAKVAASIIGRSVTSLVTNGWVLVSQLDSLVTGTSKATNATLGSSWWLVSAYNSGYGGNATLGNGNDYFKLLSVAGNAAPQSKVPEPGSLALMGAGLFAAFSVRRRQKNSAK